MDTPPRWSARRVGRSPGGAYVVPPPVMSDREGFFTHSIGFSGGQRRLFCQGQLDPGFSVHTPSSTTQLSRK